jgi:hypothetical protein
MQHLYCDPTSEERAHLGIPTQMELVNQVKAELGVSIIMGAENEAHYNRAAAQYSPVREQFWLGRLAEHRNKRILFICGSDHVETFNALLHKNGWQVQST